MRLENRFPALMDQVRAANIINVLAIKVVECGGSFRLSRRNKVRWFFVVSHRRRRRYSSIETL